MGVQTARRDRRRVDRASIAVNARFHAEIDAMCDKAVAEDDWRERAKDKTTFCSTPSRVEQCVLFSADLA